MTDTNITIIGAGIVGLAIAARLSEEFENIVVIERNSSFGQETSSRNSEVIHSGIYYPEGSLKAQLCVKGRQLLYDYCEKHEILHKKCGKLIVATDNEEEKQLPSILEQSKKNGVKTGRHIAFDEVKELEPNVIARTALFFPESGIVDSHGLMKEFKREAIVKKVDMAFNNRVTHLRRINEGYIEYKMQYVGDSLEQFVQTFLPGRMKLLFRDNSIKNHFSDATGFFAFTHIKNQDKGIQTILMDIMNHKYKYVEQIGEESLFFKNRHEISINKVNDTKKIAGYTCHKAEIAYLTDEDKKMHYNIFYTDHIDIEGFTRHTPFESIKGVLMEFQIELYQMPFRFIATKVKEKEIPEKEFIIPQGYKPVNKKTLHEIIEILKER